MVKINIGKVILLSEEFPSFILNISRLFIIKSLLLTKQYHSRFIAEIIVRECYPKLIRRKENISTSGAFIENYLLRWMPSINQPNLLYFFIMDGMLNYYAS